MGQFRDLLADSRADDDPAVARLAPDAYPDDEAASREFRRLTGGDLLERRAQDAAVLLQTLGLDGGDRSAEDDPDATITIALGGDRGLAWMRTLSALRLVLATRTASGPKTTITRRPRASGCTTGSAIASTG